MGAVGADVEAKTKRDTLLYVATSPSGAKVLVDGKPVGTTDGLFPIDPGVRRIIVELEGHDQQGKDVTIRAGDITRLKLRLKRRTEAKVHNSMLGSGATLDSILVRLKQPPQGWKVLEARDLSGDELAKAGRLEYASGMAFSRHGKVIVVGVYRFASGENLAVVEGIRDQALQSAVKYSIIRRGAPPPLGYLTCGTSGRTIVTFLAADEVDRAVLDEAIRELGFEKRLQVPLWADLPKQHELRRQDRVQLAVGKERMTLEGKPTTWEELRNRLEELPDRENTALYIARTTDDWGIAAWNEVEDRIRGACRDLGFESTSFIGVHPLGSKATLSLRLVIAGEDDMTFEGRKVKESELSYAMLSVPERYRTVLEIVRAPGGSEKLTIKEWDNLRGHAAMIANQLGFKGTTYTGEAPPGSKASTDQTESEERAPIFTPAKRPQAAFGPAVERVFTPEIPGLGTFVNLESGKTIQVPEEVMKGSSDKSLITWAKEKKVHVNILVRPGPTCYLSSLDSYFWRSDDTNWQETTANDVLTDRQLNDGEFGYGSITKRADELPAAYMFKARGCGGGLLEIVEFVEPAEDAIGVKIRYKLLRIPDEPRSDQEPAPSQLNEALELIEQNYYVGLDRPDLTEAAIRGMIEELDVRSDYFSQTDLASLGEQLPQKLSGIGLALRFDESAGELHVETPLPKMPAYRAGIRAGDSIVQIDGKPTSEFPQKKQLQTAVTLIRGKPGIAVTVGVKRSGSDEVEQIEIVREAIRVRAVKGDACEPDGDWDFMLDDDRKIGYVRLMHFNSRSADELRDAVEELQSKGMMAFILDLRNNAGGMLSQAIQVADLFVEDGVIVSIKNRQEPGKTWFAKSEGTLGEVPMAVLVNRDSVAAAEIVAACLQDHGRAIIVGERTYGKGTAHKILELKGGDGALKLPTAIFLRPNGKGIHRFDGAEEWDPWGVVPDEKCEINLSEEEYGRFLEYRRQRDVFSPEGPPATDFVDRQLQNAIERL